MAGDRAALAWEEFAAASPTIAEAGLRLLNDYGAPLAFIATVRKDGGPRLHPICPVVVEGRLWFFVAERSPKWWDLRRDPRYALHSFPAPEDEEFYVAGEARFAPEDPLLRERVAAAEPFDPPSGEALVELRIERALHTTWADFGTPAHRPVHEVWRLGR